MVSVALNSNKRELWYVRQQSGVSGPFPTAALAQDLLLGRLAFDVSVSTDGVHWVRACEVPALSPRQAGPEDWGEQRLRAARRWADQRSGRDRRQSNGADLSRGHQRGSDRRQSPAPSRDSVAPRTPHSEAVRRRAWVIVLSLAAAVGGILLLAYAGSSEHPLVVRLLK
jgi:hypothetical protein